MNKKIHQFSTKQFPKDTKVNIYKSKTSTVRKDMASYFQQFLTAVHDQTQTELLVDKQDQGNRKSPCTDT